jgi:hypothetical protein
METKRVIAENYSVQIGKDTIHYGEHGMEVGRDSPSVDTTHEVVSHWEQGSALVKDKTGQYHCVRGPKLTDADYIAQLEGQVISKHNALRSVWDGNRAIIGLNS